MHNWSWPFEPRVGKQLMGVNHLYNVVQSSPLSISRDSSPSATATSCPLNTNSPFPAPQPGEWPIYFLSLGIWLFSVLRTSKTIQYLALCVWLISLSTMSWSFIHVGAYVIMSLFSRAEYYSILRICPTLFIHSPVDGLLGCSTFRLLWVVLLWTPVCKYLSPCQFDF